VPFRIVGGFFSGAGVLTLIFIGITRAAWSSDTRIDADWTLDELDAVVVATDGEPTWGRILSIVFGVARSSS
jgi:hypothetical protein